MKNIKGITLIALVITIVVLIILAGVAINLTLGKDGILNKARKSITEYEKSQIKEELEIEIYNIQTKKIVNSEILVREDLWELNNIGVTMETVEIPAEGEYKGYFFNIDENYKVTVIGKSEETKPKKINLRQADYTGNLDYLEIKEDEIIINSVSGWAVIVVYMNNLPFKEYSKIKITYSFDAGYDWSICLYEESENYYYSLDSSADRQSHNSISKTTQIFDLPNDKNYTKLRFGSSSLNAKLHVYNIELIK